MTDRPNNLLRTVGLCFRFAGREWHFDGRPVVMGILNVTPDSFSDGGEHLSFEAAVEHGRAMIRSGAEIIDVGGESSRPGADPVPIQEEIRRVAPVIEALAAEGGAVVSVDTMKATVAEHAVAGGAVIINDISGFHGDPRMAAVVRETGVGCILMHMRGTPRTMQNNPTYDDVVGDICGFFRERIRWALEQGIKRNRIIIDLYPAYPPNRNTKSNCCSQ